MAEHSKSKSTGGFYRPDRSPCTHFRGGACSATPKLSDAEVNRAGDDRAAVFGEEDVPSASFASSAAGIEDLEGGRGSKGPKAKEGKEDIRALHYFGNMLGLF